MYCSTRAQDRLQVNASEQRSSLDSMRTLLLPFSPPGMLDRLADHVPQELPDDTTGEGLRALACVHACMPHALLVNQCTRCTHAMHLMSSRHALGR